MNGEAETRAGLYLLLAALLREAPHGAVLSRLRNLEIGTDDELGRVLAALRQAAGVSDPSDLEREFHALFIGVTQGELMPYASWYQDGHLHGNALVRLRADMGVLGVGCTPDNHEPEDHIAVLCETSALLILQGDDRQKGFYRQHLMPWAARFFADLAQAEAARFYRAVGRLGQVFMALENRHCVG